ncbi:MAG: FHA domain-containing protein [Pseudomonadota bacterium]
MSADALLVEVHDAAVRVHDGAKPLAVEVGYATVTDSKVVQTGDASRADAKRHPRRTVNDFWHRLSTQPLDNMPLTRADLAAAQVQSLLPTTQYADRNVVLLLPGALPREQIGLLLGVFEACRLPVVGIVDAAVAATRHHYANQTLLHIDVGLHATTVSRLRQSDALSALDDVRAVDDCGLQTLMDAWLKFFATEFVRQCRFDPLHSAAAEQHLFDALPAWLQQVEQQPQTQLAFSTDGHEHTIDVNRVDVVNVVASYYQRIADVARALLGGGQAPALQFRVTSLALPGFTEMLCARTGGAFFTVADDAPVAHTAHVLANLALDSSRVLSEMPVDGTRAANAPVEQASADTPSHVLLDAHAYALSAQPLTIGSGSEQAVARYLRLEGNPAGVSGVHCELRLDTTQCVVLDHSRYGTFLNGNRISGSAALRIGDVLRVGTPGRELQLIRMEAL